MVVAPRSLDVPMAAELLGKLIGLAVAEGALPAGRLADLYGQCDTAEYRRDFVAIALKTAKVLPALLVAIWFLCYFDAFCSPISLHLRHRTLVSKHTPRCPSWPRHALEGT